MPLKINLIFTLILFSSPALQADTLGIPGHYESASTLIMPQRGLSMDRVLEEFGEPERRMDTVGEPPITTWDYGEFRVFFEYQTVLHSLNLNTLIVPGELN